ncbi:DUF2946 domain-containing protein [Pseudomonas sp. R76]|uniref:DUF2946 domain-containing protein n=1 Tax=Pseudomonas sp. R76 TaxID=1573711 RepID=UPI0009BD5742
MLMIFVGPLISQTMPMNHTHVMPPGTSMDMGGGVPPQHCIANQSTKAASALHPLWEKCGYCSLLFSSPALASLPKILIGVYRGCSTRLMPYVSGGYGRETIFPGARTRAPPSSLPGETLTWPCCFSASAAP